MYSFSNTIYKLKCLDADIDMAEKNTRESSIPKAGTATTKRGMVLPFKPLSLAFDHVNYYVNMPTVNSTHSSPNLTTFKCYFSIVFRCFLFLPVISISVD